MLTVKLLPYRGEPVLNVYPYIKTGHQNELSTVPTISVYYTYSNSLQNFYVVGELKYKTNTIFAKSLKHFM